MINFNTKLRGIRKTLRKASNPNHEPAGSNKGGQFACKNCGAEHGSQKELDDHRTKKHTDSEAKSRANLTSEKSKQHKDNVEDFGRDVDRLKSKAGMEQDDEGGDLSVNSASEEIVSNLELNPKMTMRQIKDDLYEDGFDPEIVDKGWSKAEKNYNKILKKINRDVLGDDYEEDDEDRNEKVVKEIETGDLVDFGDYGKLYVVDKDYLMSNGQTWWVTDDPKELKKDRASGWSIRPSQAVKILKTRDEMDNPDDDSDDEETDRHDAKTNRNVRGHSAKYDYNPREGKMQTGSLVDSYKSGSGDRYVAYFLINTNENLKKWGVTPSSIKRHIASFRGMPFVITSKKFFDKSPYGDITDHPSTDHFGSLGIHRPKEHNDMMQQASFQEEFRVGNIEDIFNKGDDQFALIKIDPKFKDHQMPPLVSPAVFQLNPHEPANKIETWIGMHLAGLDEKPAYGNAAVYRGSCVGTKGECLRQLSAKHDGMVAILPCTKKHLAMANLKIASLRIAMMRKAMQMSSDHPEIQALNLYDEDEDLEEI